MYVIGERFVKFVKVLFPSFLYHHAPVNLNRAEAQDEYSMNNKDLMASMGFNEPDSSILQPTAHTSHGMAHEFLSRLCDYITRFEQSLADDEELALKVVSFGEAVTIIVEDIGYWNPSLISFYGVNTANERVQLIQHVSQLSFLLVAVKAAQPVTPRRRIGFKLRDEADDMEARGREMDQREA